MVHVPDCVTHTRSSIISCVTLPLWYSISNCKSKSRNAQVKKKEVEEGRKRGYGMSNYRRYRETGKWRGTNRWSAWCWGMRTKARPTACSVNCFFFALLSFLSMLGTLKEHRKNSIRAARFAGLNGGKLRLILLGSMASRTPTRLKARRQSLDDL